MSEPVCRKCGEPITRLMLFALFAEAGSHVYPGPLDCPKGDEHDMEEIGAPTPQ